MGLVLYAYQAVRSQERCKCTLEEDVNSERTEEDTENYQSSKKKKKMCKVVMISLETLLTFDSLLIVLSLKNHVEFGLYNI